MKDQSDEGGEQEVNKVDVDKIFQDYEARSNLVGFYALALKVARGNPKLWAEITERGE
jgi:hypothetical protein